MLTVESLLFAGMGVALTLSGPQPAIRDLALRPSTLGKVVATFITGVAVAAVLMWTSVFADPWPCDLRGTIVAVVVLAAVVGEAVFAWFVAVALRPKTGAPPK